MLNSGLLTLGLGAASGLHLLGCVDPEQSEATAKDAGGELREPEPARPHLVGGSQDRAALVEASERRRQLVEVGAEIVRLKLTADEVDDFP